MSFTLDEKRQLAMRAQSLSERLADSEGDVEPMVGDSIESVIEMWKGNVADGERKHFHRRLEIDGVTEAEVPDRLAASEYSDSESLPEWIEPVSELQTYLETGEHDPFAVPSTAGEDEVPFEHHLTAITEFALERLDRPKASSRISGSALQSSADALMTTLQRFFAHPLFVDFKTALKNEEVGDEGNENSRVGYRTFVQQQLDDGLRTFFLEYAVLARWTAIIIDQWVTTLEEFVERLERDWASLEALVGEDLVEVSDVELLGDRHHGGRRVIGITFSSGEKVAYKPRSVEPEVSYNEYLAWFNAESSLLDLRTVDCLPKDGYGWIEWIEPAECPNEEAVSRYYERVGILTCVLYSLRFADGNIENLVAEASHPVVLDLEALLQPKLPADHLFGNPSLEALIDESVLQTGIVPVKLGDDVKDVNGIDAARGEQSGTFRKFTAVNTDAMDLHFEDSVHIEGESLPRIDDRTFDPRDYADELIHGFREAYDFLLDNRGELLSEDGPIEAFRELETRFFYRSTSTYATVRRPLLTSAYLRSGLSAGVRTELLAKWIDWDEFDDELWEVYRAERDALWRFDIPRFTVDTSQRHVFLEDRTVESVLDATPLQQVRRRIENMNREDRRCQVDYLVTAYDRDRVLNPSPPVNGFVSNTTPEWDEIAERKSTEILERLRDTATRNSNGELVWHDRVNHGDGVYLRPIRDDLYEGRIGIGVFAAAMAKTFDREECRNFVAEAVAPILTDFEDGDPRFADKKLGAAHGLGSLVYGFTKMGAWLDEDRYVRVAEELSSLVTDERLAQDDVYDLIGGSAGAILGLLALYDETGNEQVLERATAAGDVLLEKRIDVNGAKIWPTYGGQQPALNGAGHGISGIAFALYRLGGAVERPLFKEAALESLGFEEEQYSPSEQNWPDFRFDSHRPGWCAGRAGVGMSRLGMLEVDERDKLKRDLDRALRGLDHETLATEDQLCCGNFGRVEFLLRASTFREDGEYARRARELAAGVVRRADRDTGLSIPWQTDHWYSKSLFLGEPGIGYSLLRLAGADLPCLLLWE